MADARDSKSRTPSAQPLETQASYDTSPDRLGRALGAFAAKIAPVAPDLSAVLSAWASLPDPIKAGIVAMVKTAALAAQAGTGRINRERQGGTV
ncbi:MAG: hypothetical protein ACYS5V_08185 [Planctomycetota bacterium]